MGRCTCSELREKEVINLCDGRRLGFVCDVEFELCDGRITAIIVPGESSLLGFGRCEMIVIPWDKIETIGSDAILVRVQISEWLSVRGETARKNAKNPACSDRDVNCKKNVNLCGALLLGALHCAILSIIAEKAEEIALPRKKYYTHSAIWCPRCPFLSGFEMPRSCGGLTEGGHENVDYLNQAAA